MIVRLHVRVVLFKTLASSVCVQYVPASRSIHDIACVYVSAELLLVCQLHLMQEAIGIS